MYCPTCGRENKDDALFCSYCGKKLTIAEYDLSGLNLNDEEPLDKGTGDNEKHEKRDDAENEQEKNTHIEKVTGVAVLTPLTKVTLVLLLLCSALFGVAWVAMDMSATNERDLALADSAPDETGDRTQSASNYYEASTEQNAEGSASANASANANALNSGISDDIQEAFDKEARERENRTFSCAFLNASTGASVTNISVYLSPGSDLINFSPEYQLDLDSEGKAISNAVAGDYTLSWYAEGYCQDYKNITVTGEKQDISVNLLPVAPGAQSLNIMLEWEGAQDLDIVLFDAHRGQYVSILYPESNGNFLFVDTDASRHCEVIRISDFTQSYVYSVFVRDDALLKSVNTQAAASDMEKDGVTVTVATSGGIVFKTRANAENTAALWLPCYVYEGSVYLVDNYITDYTNYSWAFYDKSVR